MELIDDEVELRNILDEIHRSRAYPVQDSMYDGLRFWHALGNENAPEFPTLYWTRELEIKVLKQMLSEDMR
jgi:hypothetical protein